MNMLEISPPAVQQNHLVIVKTGDYGRKRRVKMLTEFMVDEKQNTIDKHEDASLEKAEQDN